MKRKLGKYHRQGSLLFWAMVFIGALIGTIALNVAIATIQHPQPQAILCLGGDHRREKLAAKLANQNSELLIWVSSGSDDQITKKIFQDADIPVKRFFLDNRATDTVTNFTTLLGDFKQHHIKHLYVITSDFHMARSKAIATIILSSQGIAFTTMEIRTKRDREPKVKIIRDIGRSILWFFSGYTGANLNGFRNHNS